MDDDGGALDGEREVKGRLVADGGRRELEDDRRLPRARRGERARPGDKRGRGEGSEGRLNWGVVVRRVRAGRDDHVADGEEEQRPVAEDGRGREGEFVVWCAACVAKAKTVGVMRCGEVVVRKAK